MDEITSYLSEIQKSLSKTNKLSVISDTSVTEKLNKTYNNLLTSISEFSDIYKSIGTEQMKVADSLIQLNTYIIYFSKFLSSLKEYKTLYKFSAKLFDSSSNINTLLNNVSISYSLYKNSLDDTKKAFAKELINKNLDKLKSEITEDITELNIFPFNCTYDKINNVLTSNKIVNLTKTVADSYDIYSGNIDTNGIVAQKALLYVLQKNGEADVNVSIPLLKMNYLTFKDTVYGRITNDMIHDYTCTRLVENIDTTETQTSHLKFGNSVGEILKNGASQNVKFRYADDSELYSGLIQYKSQFTDNEFNYYEEKDSITLTRKITYKNISYTLSGTLQLQQDLTDDYNTKNNTTRMFIYKGKIKTSETGKTENNTSTTSYFDSKTIICQVNKQDNTYDIYSYYDPDTTSNASSVDNGSDKDLISNIASVFKYSLPYNKATAHKIFIDETNYIKKICSDILVISNLALSDESFESKFVSYYSDLNYKKENIISEIVEKIKSLNEFITAITYAQSSYSANDSNYSQDYLSDITTAITTITSDLQKYLTTSDSDNIEDLYNDTLYNVLVSDVEEIETTLSATYDDLLLAESELYNLDREYYPISGCVRNYVNFSETNNIFYKILSGNISSSIITNDNIKITILDYETWYKFYENNFRNNNDQGFPIYLVNLLYIYSQTINTLDTTDADWYKDIHDFFNQLILRICALKMDNIYFNSYISDSDATVIRNYISNCNITYNYSDNILKIRPQLYLYLNAKELNNYDIDEILLNFKSGSIKQFYPAIYKGLMTSKNKTEFCNKIISLNTLFDSIDTLNLRELLYKYSFYLIINNLLNKDLEITNITKEKVNSILNTIKANIDNYINYKNTIKKSANDLIKSNNDFYNLVFSKKVIV